MSKGRLIVIDGIDGSGKATQVKLLKERLTKEGIKVKTIDFPRYYNNFFGKLIGEYLSGVYGDFIKVDPRLASVLYASDRFESSREIQKWLDDGFVVLADRYATANQIHQGGKISNLKKRKEFLDFLDKMEYSVFKIPRPDLVIYLDVPFEVSKMWLERKVTQRKKTYLKGRRDVAEDNLLHLKNSRNSALLLEKQNKNWTKIECCKGKVCMLPEEVGERVYKIVKTKIKK
ncbi:MAG: deoxynucleoside kinase [Minisyncoccia bacterium]